jgi:DNA-directed RNA polymerase specialized sigma24 family protein
VRTRERGSPGESGISGDEMDELTRLAVDSCGGEPAVMGSFIRATQRDVYSLCAYLVDEDTAEALAQEAYLRMFGALPDFQESSARIWLLSITSRVCIDELRRRVRGSAGAAGRCLSRSSTPGSTPCAVRSGRGPWPRMSKPRYESW